jgi:hypothetical protein
MDVILGSVGGSMVYVYLMLLGMAVWWLFFKLGRLMWWW